jgi:hypothetical protein
MRCTIPGCSRPARLVVDWHPRRTRTNYTWYCWLDYFEVMAAGEYPMIVNFIDQGDKDDSLKWDAHLAAAIDRPC